MKNVGKKSGGGGSLYGPYRQLKCQFKVLTFACVRRTY